MIPAERKSIVVPLRIRVDLAQKIDLAVSLLKYRSRNQLIREALEQYTNQLLRTKSVIVKDVPIEKATTVIDEYLSKNPGAHYVSDIAEALGIKLSTAFKTMQKLIHRGQVEVRER